MKAKDVQPTRLGAAQKAATVFLGRVPEKFRVGVVSFATRAVVGVAPTKIGSSSRPRSTVSRPGEGTAIGDAVVLSAQLGRNRRSEEGSAPPRSVLLISDGARDGGAVAPQAAARRAKQLKVPVYTVLVGTQDGVVEETLTGGFRQIIRVPASAGTLKRSPSSPAASSSPATDAEGLERVYKDLASRLGTRKESREVGDYFAGGAGGVLDRGRRALGALVQEGPVKKLLILGGLCALMAGSAPAQAADECDGLMVCVPVAGPWVSVPVGTSVPRPHVEYQLRCPRGHIVGGLDAEVSDRGIDITFIGELGSPVNPGITTSRSVVFVASYVGATARAPTFQAVHRLHAGARGRSRADCGRGDPQARESDDPARADHPSPSRDEDGRERLSRPRGARRRRSRVRIPRPQAAERERRRACRRHAFGQRPARARASAGRRRARQRSRRRPGPRRLLERQMRRRLRCRLQGVRLRHRCVRLEGMLALPACPSLLPSPV